MINLKANEQSLKKFFNSPGGLVIYGIIEIIGWLAGAISSILDFAKEYKLLFIIIAIVFISVGLFLLIRYAYIAYKNNKVKDTEIEEIRKKLSILSN